MDMIRNDPAMMRAYENYAKALSDWTSGINGAKRERSVEIAQNLQAMGFTPSQIAQATGVSINAL
jgi:hypothetical protein